MPNLVFASALAQVQAQSATPAAAVQPPPPPADPFAPALPLPAGVHRMTSPCGTSVVTHVTREAISALGRVPGLHQPGVYVGLWHRREGTAAYVGLATEDLVRRVQSQPNLRGVFPADEVVIISATRECELTAQDAAALERTAHAALAAQPGLTVANKVPPLGVPEHPDLARVQLFWAGAALAGKRLGVLLAEVSDRDLIAGPPSPALAGPVRYPREHVLKLAMPALPVYAVPQRDGSCVILEGSQIEAVPLPKTSAEARMLRAELLHAGLLVETLCGPPGRLTVTANLRLKSPDAAVVFAAGIGARQVSPEAWRPLGPDELVPSEEDEVELLRDGMDEPVLPEDDEDQRGPGRR